MTDATGPAVVIERRVEAPIDLVWRLWTEPERFARWYGPTGSSVPVAEWRLAVGERRRVCLEMTTPDGPMRMWFVGEFLTIDEPGRLSYTEAVADEDGRVRTAEEMGMPAEHPVETVVDVELRPDGAATELVLTHRGIPADSPGAAGWAMALDALDALATAIT